MVRHVRTGDLYRGGCGFQYCLYASVIELLINLLSSSISFVFSYLARFYSTILRKSLIFFLLVLSVSILSIDRASLFESTGSGIRLISTVIRLWPLFVKVVETSEASTFRLPRIHTLFGELVPL